MIGGVGIDVVALERFRRVYAKHGQRLLNAVFCPLERDLPVESLAARFAAKEAVIKALRRTDIPLKCICIDAPATEVRLSNPKVLGRILVSISHERDLAIAVALWEVE